MITSLLTDSRSVGYFLQAVFFFLVLIRTKDAKDTKDLKDAKDKKRHKRPKRYAKMSLVSFILYILVSHFSIAFSSEIPSVRFLPLQWLQLLGGP